ncbi:MAG: serine hydrolase domain-containing protein [Planctomycetota bacterium]
MNELRTTALILLLTAAAVAGPPGTFRQQVLASVEPLVEARINKGDFPGCVVEIGRQSGPLLTVAYGERSVEPSREAMTVDTVFDLASLTKPVATATCVMQLIEEGALRLRTPVADVLPEFAQNGKGRIRVEHLLTHAGGLIADNPIGDYRDGPQRAWERINALTPLAAPGERFIYTDVGFLCLGRIVETLRGEPLDRVARQRVFQPLGMLETGYTPSDELTARIAPTEQQDGEWLRGRVHDPRAALLGGVAGHAGLFSTAADLGRYARAMLGGGALADARVLSPAAVSQMTQPREVAGVAKRALGWDARSGYSSNRGDLMSGRAFGHGGFTGTGMWIDPELDLYVIFLSNRLHPDGKGTVNDLIGRIGSIAAAQVTALSDAED